MGLAAETLRRRIDLDRSAQLANLLTAHTPHDATEASHLEFMREGIASGDVAFARSRYDPGHFTASGFVLSAGGDALLMIFHEKLQRWLQPGGHVEPSDAGIAETAWREVAEETGLADHVGVKPAIFDVDVHPIPGSSHEPAHRHLDVRFLFRAGSSKLVAGSGVSRARWTPFAELASKEPSASLRRILDKLQIQT